MFIIEDFQDEFAQDADDVVLVFVQRLLAVLLISSDCNVDLILRVKCTLSCPWTDLCACSGGTGPSTSSVLTT